MAAEIFAPCAGYDSGFALQHFTTGNIWTETGAIFVYRQYDRLGYSASLCKAAERRLLVDIYGIREAYHTGEIHNICAIDTAVNHADGMTKVKPTSFCT